MVIPSSGRRIALSRACFALNGIIVGLIVLGALVRAHGAGLACPDWPLCFGELVPTLDLRVAFEYTHRVVAGSLGLAYVALGAALLRDPDARAAGARVWAIGLALLGAQVLLGALTVWHALARWSVTSHLLVGNTWNASVLWLGLSLRDAADRARRPARAARVTLGLAVLFLIFQIALGGLVSSSYAGLACPDWPTCYRGEWFPIWGFESPVGIQVHHRVNGYMLAVLVGLAAWAGRRELAVAGATRLAALLVGVQIAVGVANVLLQLRVEVTALHTGLAALLVLTLTYAVHAAFAAPVRQESPA
jgi:cytochrome c oxidase assembly protein subunit 15